jgi:curli biogenesis system outer membrane secretion channel CsgG
MTSALRPFYIRLLVAACVLVGWFMACQSIPIEEKKIQTIAVWDLENLNKTEPTAFDLGELLSNKIIEALIESGRWKVVERKQILLALEELNLSSTSMVLDSTRLEIGRLIGAQYMVFGTYMQMMQTMHLNLRLVDVETGRVIKAAERSTLEEDFGKWLELAREAAKELQK